MSKLNFYFTWFRNEAVANLCRSNQAEKPGKASLGEGL